jgi:hypothetical protein
LATGEWPITAQNEIMDESRAMESLMCMEHTMLLDGRFKNARGD